MGQIGCPINCAQALEDREGPLSQPVPALFQGGRILSMGAVPGGFHFSPGLAPGTYSSRPSLPRAGCLAIWPAAPGASPGPPGPKKKLFWICRRRAPRVIYRACYSFSLPLFHPITTATTQHVTANMYSKVHYRPARLLPKISPLSPITSIPSAAL